MVCYRRHGHNEGDEPSFTQPLMYDLIEAKRSTRKLYTESLIGRGDITMEEAEAALRDYQRQLERAFTETREATQRAARAGRGPQAGAGGAPGQPHRGAHGDQPGGGQADHRDPGDPARGLHAAPAAAAPAGPALGHDHRRHHRLGHRRAAGVRRPAAGQPSGPPGRAGQPPRHVRPAARGRGRPAQRQRVHPAEAVRPRVMQVLRLRLAAVRVRRDGLRVRLLGGPAGRPGGLGGPVRRLLQRGPGRSSTSSSARASRSGASTPAWSCCCHTASRARARTTPRPGSNGSCPCVPRTT